jgi:uncharacterized protein YndB with AHSA1/START domain
MANPEPLKVSAHSDQEIAIARAFGAPRRLVFEALIRPELLERWLLGPPGWSMVVCQVEPRAGGGYRWVWRNDSDGTDMGMGGVFHEVVPPERLVATEKFDRAWYPGEAVVTQTLAEQGGTTTLTIVIRYESREARDGVMRSRMTDGLAASYDRLDGLLRERLAAEQGVQQQQ